jgi:hypothetical protein
MSLLPRVRQASVRGWSGGRATPPCRSHETGKVTSRPGRAAPYGSARQANDANGEYGVGDQHGNAEE